jgi:Tfp pilus assembly protein PilF
MEAWVKAHPEDAAALLELARLKDDKDPTAVKYREKYLRLKSGDRAVELELAPLYEKQGDFSHDYKFNLRLAKGMDEAGKKNEAARFYKKAWSIQPKDEKVIARLTEMALAAGDSAAALEHAKEWTQRISRSRRGHELLKDLASGKGREMETYIASLENLIELEPEKAAPRQLELGFMQFERGRDVEAEKWLKAAGKAYPKNAELWYALGTLHDKTLFHGNGREDYKKAYLLKPENKDYARAYGKWLKTEKDLKEVRPGNGKVLFNLNRAWRKIPWL